MTGEPQRTTYDNYLRLPELKALLRPLTANRHERHFIRIHQAQELLYGQIVDDLRALVELLDSDRFTTADQILDRIHRTVTAAIAQLDTLRALPPRDFAAFRDSLGTASGFQSTQFREIELLSGLADDTHYLRHLRAMHGGALPAGLARVWRERSVAQAHQEALHRHSHRRSHQPLSQVTAQLQSYEQLWLSWRTEHADIVRGLLGTSPGTAGQGLPYLARTLELRFFPHLSPSSPVAPHCGSGTTSVSSDPNMPSLVAQGTAVRHATRAPSS